MKKTVTVLAWIALNARIPLTRLSKATIDLNRFHQNRLLGSIRFVLTMPTRPIHSKKCIFRICSKISAAA
jgi:hypothetical protein